MVFPPNSNYRGKEMEAREGKGREEREGRGG
jgi:hypothetical protein